MDPNQIIHEKHFGLPWFMFILLFFTGIVKIFFSNQYVISKYAWNTAEYEEYV